MGDKIVIEKGVPMGSVRGSGWLARFDEFPFHELAEVGDSFLIPGTAGLNLGAHGSTLANKARGRLDIRIKVFKTPDGWRVYRLEETAAFKEFALRRAQKIAEGKCVALSDER
jgi:hypothetical protein